MLDMQLARQQLNRLDMKLTNGNHLLWIVPSDRVDILVEKIKGVLNGPYLALEDDEP